MRTRFGLQGLSLMRLMQYFRWKFILIGLTAFLWNVAPIPGQRCVHGADPWIGYSHDAGKGSGYQDS